MALPRILTNLAGRMKELLPVQTSAGAADAEKLPALNASGVLDSTILNGATTSAGVASAGKTVVLKADGTIDTTMMPAGIGASTKLILASEALAAGNLVNVYNNAGTPNVRKADATIEGKEANGFVLSAVSSGANATVYADGQITGLTGMTPGTRQYLATSPGLRTETAPTATGNVVQMIGYALDATTLDYDPQDPITRA